MLIVAESPPLLRLFSFLSALLLPMVVAIPAMAQVFNPTSFTLPNGLQVVVVENHRAPIVSHMVWYRTGAADEPAGKGGIAHLLEHLMFKGTDSIPVGEFSKTIARNGGRDNAMTSMDFTAYYQNIAVDRLDMVMAMEADRMRNLKISDSDFLTERDVVMEERRSRTDNDPAALLLEQMTASLYTIHPYRAPIIGWSQELQALSRADALEFYRRWYAPNNAIVVVAGDVNPEEVKALAEKHYGPLQAEAGVDRRRPQEPLALVERRLSLSNDKVQQPSWTRFYLAPSYANDPKQQAYALEVVAEALGGNNNSHLYDEVVIRQGLASHLSVSYDPTALDSTVFHIYALPRDGVTMEALEAAIVRSLDKIRQDGLSAEEIARAQERMKANLVYARDSAKTGAYTLGMALTTGQTVADVESWPQRIAAVAVEQVNAVLRDVVRDETAVTGLLLPKPPTAAKTAAKTASTSARKGAAQ